MDFDSRFCAQIAFDDSAYHANPDFHPSFDSRGLFDYQRAAVGSNTAHNSPFDSKPVRKDDVTRYFDSLAYQAIKIIVPDLIGLAEFHLETSSEMPELRTAVQFKLNYHVRMLPKVPGLEQTYGDRSAQPVWF
jgi:hypothetical protein